MQEECLDGKIGSFDEIGREGMPGRGKGRRTCRVVVAWFPRFPERTDDIEIISNYRA